MGGQKGPIPKICHKYQQWLNLIELYFIHPIHTPWVLLTSGFFSPVSLKVVLIKMAAILTMPAKLTTLGLLKIRYFEIKVMTS